MVNLVILTGLTLFILGAILFDKTFISFRTQIIIVLSGAAIGIAAFHFVWRQKKYGLIATLFLGIFLGASIPYCFIATTNYYLREDKSENVLLEILETGYGSGRRRECKTPYAVIEYQNIKKDINFDCRYVKIISNYKTLRLKISKGFWGFPVYTDKKINS